MRAAGQRPLARRVHGRGARQLPLHGRGLDRRVRCLGGTTSQRRIDADGHALRRSVGSAARRRGRGARAAARTHARCWRLPRRLTRAEPTRARRALASRRELADAARELPRPRARDALRPRARAHRRPRARALLDVVRVLSALRGGRAGRARHVRDREAAACRTSRQMGFDVVYLPPIHPIGRAQPQGQEQRAHGRRRRVGQPVGDRRRPRAGTRRASASSARWRISGSSAAPRERRHRVALDIAFQCSPDHPVRAGASAVVQAAARRQRAVRGEPAEEIPGHLSVRLRERRLGVAVAELDERRRRSGSSRA